MDTGITVPLNVREAWVIETGEKIVVDDRTFNPEWHTLEEPKKDEPVV